MPAVTHARTIALLTLFCAALPSAPVSAQADTGQRIDRTVVSPFSGSRRIVVQPGPDGGSEVVAMGADFEALAIVRRPAPVYAPAPAASLLPEGPALPEVAAAPAAQFIDIGSLDALPSTEQAGTAPAPAGLIGTPCGADCPAQRIEFSDIQPYYGTTAPPSSFPPD